MQAHWDWWWQEGQGNLSVLVCELGFAAFYVSAMLESFCFSLDFSAQLYFIILQYPRDWEIKTIFANFNDCNLNLFLYFDTILLLGAVSAAT